MPSDHFSVLSEVDRSRLRRSAPPQWVDPMLATLTTKSFSDPSWMFERKLDGIRCLAFRDGDEVRMLTRNKQRLDRTYPEILDALRAQRTREFVVDGEVVAMEDGRTSFALLQQRSGIADASKARRSTVGVFYFLFDVLHLEGYDTRSVPLRSRKRLLEKTFDFAGPLRFSPHRDTDGEVFFEEACSQGWEGLVAKRADSSYTSRRSRDWLKLKCIASQEMVIVGFTEPSGSRTGFGALLLGYYEGDDLVYAGKVGTGFDERTLRGLRAELDRLEVGQSPLAGSTRFDRSTHFVRPQLVADVSFTEWTRDGMLRHPTFHGLRQDKSASEVHRERPQRRM